MNQLGSAAPPTKNKSSHPDTCDCFPVMQRSCFPHRGLNSYSHVAENVLRGFMTTTATGSTAGFGKGSAGTSRCQQGSEGVWRGRRAMVGHSRLCSLNAACSFNNNLTFFSPLSIYIYILSSQVSALEDRVSRSHHNISTSNWTDPRHFLKNSCVC